jgi:agmatinase
VAAERAFDPNAAAKPGSGIYGLPTSEADAKVVVLPVPFDATTSYRRGAALGPAAVLEASRQVDLYDREVGRPYEAGVAMRAEDPRIVAMNVEARAAADPVIAVGGVEGRPDLVAAVARVDALGEAVNRHVYEATRELLARGQISVVLGGDHAVPFGAIQAYAERYPGLGVLHVDAHADLRPAYEGFTWSHASIFYNVHQRLDGVARLVQVGIRDFSEEELAIVQGSQGRIVTHFDADVARARFEGRTFAQIVDAMIEPLPRDVYVSFDIDGLDPSLCPNTGTPVPGGLAFHEASYVVARVVRSGRRVVGADLCEVAPGPSGEEWDANVGARLLYKLIGYCLSS